MIQVYDRDNTEYDKNGNMTLLPTACELTCEINGAWELTLSHPIDVDGRWKYLEEEAVICTPTFQGDHQLFRIDRCVKTDISIEATAYPIFFDGADDCFLMDVRPTDKNGQDALAAMTAGSKYTGESDITTVSTAYFIRRNLLDAINGEDEPTFIQTWGGEILYDNFHVVINERIGGDYGVEIRYGKNMEGLSCTVDMSDLVTRIVPVAYNGRMMSGKSPWVDSENISKYAKKYIKEVKFEDVKLEEDASDSAEENGDTICRTQEELNKALTEKCKSMYDDGCDVPSVTIEANMIDLARTDQYEDVKGLTVVRLGDTVHCYNKKLDITTEARVIKMTWDCIKNHPSELTLGDFEYSYFSDMTSAMDAVNDIIGPGNTVMAERVKGIINGVNAQMRAQSSVAEKQEVRAMLFEDLDPDSPNFGAMCMGTMGFQIAGKRTEDGRDWDWSTFGTGAGFFADFIVAGTMLADRIKGGTLELGGKGNGNGVARVIDGNGKEIVRMDNAGIYTTGKYICKSDIYGRSIEISEGEYKIVNKNGKTVARIFAVSDDMVRIEAGNGEDTFIRMLGNEKAIYIDAKTFGINGMPGKSGRIEFSDGTYINIEGGVITGGKAQGGVF